jgi:phosphatidylglycerophosphate synthase
LADVRRSYTLEKAWTELEGELPVYLIYRPLSFPVSWALLRLGVPILAVTLCSGVLACTMVTLAWRGGPHAFWAVAALGFCFHVLDCVDGNMARTAGRSSNLGGLIDGLIDMTYWALLFLSMGFLVEHAGGGVLGDRAVAFGLGLAVIVLLNRQTRDNFALNFSRSGATYFKSEIPERLTLVDKLLIGVVGLENLYVFAIALGGVFGVLDWVLVGVGVYVVAIFIGAMAMTLAKVEG